MRLGTMYDATLCENGQLVEFQIMAFQALRLVHDAFPQHWLNTKV